MLLFICLVHEVFFQLFSNRRMENLFFDDGVNLQFKRAWRMMFSFFVADSDFSKPLWSLSLSFYDGWRLRSKRDQIVAAPWRTTR